MVGRQKQWENIQGQKGFGGESCLTCMGSPSPSSPRSPVLQHCSKMKTPHGRAASTAVPSPQTGEEPAANDVGVTGRGLHRAPPWHYDSSSPPTPGQQAPVVLDPGPFTPPTSLTLLPWGLYDLFKGPWPPWLGSAFSRAGAPSTCPHGLG